MSEHDANYINRLIGRFMDLQERWESNPTAFDWAPLRALAEEGAHAYNEGAGPSFHALALDGVDHAEFHERFLAYSIEAGFDPFKLARAGAGPDALPVIDHGSLAGLALSNPSSARMRALLMELARARLEPLMQDFERSPSKSSHWLFHMAEACAESIPLDLLERIAPEMAVAHHGRERKLAVDPVEGYLCTAEAIVESNSRPYG